VKIKKLPSEEFAQFA